MNVCRRSLGALSILLLAGAGTISAENSSPTHLYKLARKAESEGHIAQAYLLYTEAAAADPNKALYRERAAALEPMAALEAKVKPPELPGEAVDDTLDVDLDSVFDTADGNQQELLPPPHLDLKSDVQDYAFDGDFKAIYQAAATKLGLQVVFDSDFTTARRTRIKLDQVDPRVLLHSLEAATDTFITPLSNKLILVAQDTDAKRKEYEPTEEVTVPVSTALTTQELTELGQAIKQSVGVEKMYWDAAAGQIILKDHVTRANAAQAVLRDLVSYKAQVAVDFEFIELDDSEMLDIGADIPTSFPFTFLGGLANGSGAVSFASLAKFSLGQWFGVGISNIDFTATLTKARARNLLKTTIVSVEGQKATLKIGSKYPILTSQYVGGGNTGGQVYTPTPSFTFEDLGVVINVTPHVHDMGEVTLDFDGELKVLGAGTVDNIPIISSRKITSVFRLRNNESAFVAGLTSDSATRTTTGPALFSRIPLLGNLISMFTRNKTHTYIVMVIKPRLLSLPANQRVMRAIWVGSESRDVTPL